jgi:hypothetical protein
MNFTSWLRRFGYLIPCVLVASACERRGWQVSDDVPINGGIPPFATGGSFSGTAGTSGVAGGIPTEMCLLDTTKAGSPIFLGQTVSHLLPARKELFAVVNDAEAAALRGGAPLVPEAIENAPQTPLGAILQSLTTSTSESRRTLAKTLIPRFKSVRSTWPNPWALRLIDHPGSEHMNVLRIILRGDALIVRIAQGAPLVVDVDNKNVAIEVANAHPELIAAIYYQVDSSQPVGVPGDRCENGMREIALANEAMVEAWSLGTTEISKRLDADIALLQSLFEAARPCTNLFNGTSFRSFTTCTTWQSFSASTESLAYQWSLSTPSEAYKPTPQNLATLIQALQDDRFEPDPFVVEPEPPIVIGGAGGEGGQTQSAGAAGETGMDAAGAGGMGGAN